MIEVLDGEIGEAEAFARRSGDVEQGVVKVGGGAVSGFAIPGVAQVAALGLEPSAEVADEEEGPFEALRMMALAVVAGVDSEGVVEHGAVAFGNGIELF